VSIGGFSSQSLAEPSNPLDELRMNQRGAPPFPLFPPVKLFSLRFFLNRSTQSGPIGGIFKLIIGVILSDLRC
jgi:hypothetical protein